MPNPKGSAKAKAKPKPKAPDRLGYKNMDRHRFRKVLVWIIPIIVSGPLGLAFTAKGALFIWSVVLVVIIVLAYALFLLEWYVWKENPARKRARISFVALCVIVAMCGVILQHRITASPSPFVFGERPNLNVEKLGFVKFEPGKNLIMPVTLRNRGTAPARRVRTGGKIEIRKGSPRDDRCPPVVRLDEQRFSERAGASLAIGEDGILYIASDEVLSEDIVRGIMVGQYTLLLYVIVEYGSDGQTTPYRTEHYVYYDPRITHFPLCPNHNDAS